MKSKRRILIVSCVHPPYVSENNGVASVLKRTYELLGRDFDFSVFSLGKSGGNTITEEETIYNGIPVRFLHNVKNSQNDFFYRFKEEDYNNSEIEPYFEKFLKEIDPDVVHFHSINGLGANLIDIAKKYDKKVVVTFHDFWFICPSIFLTDANDTPIDIMKNGCKQCQYLKQISKVFPDKRIKKDLEMTRKKYLYKQLQKADAVIVNSSFMKPIYEKVFPNIKYHLINNPVDVPTDFPELKQPSEDKIVIGFLGGISNFKGYDTLITAFSNLRTEKQLELHIYGSPKDSIIDNLKKLLKKLRSFDELRLSIQKILHGNNSVTSKSRYPIMNKGLYTKENKFDVINSMDIVIIPSKARESFSLTTIESMLMGKYVIASDSGGQKELAKKQTYHGIFKTGNAFELKKEIEKAITIVRSEKYTARNKNALKLVKVYNRTFEESYKKIYSNLQN